MRVTPAAAAEIGQSALIWLIGRPEALEAFLGASGADAAEIRARAGEPEFLGFVLEFLLQSEDLTVDFARDAGLRPEAPARARAALPGGDAPDWT
jgi:hypothetical protein